MPVGPLNSWRADPALPRARRILSTNHPLRGVYERGGSNTLAGACHSREALAPVFAELNKYDVTTHFVGQSAILTLTDDQATGEAYCLAHHVAVDGGKRRLMVASLRYLDTFAERRLYVDWLEERALSWLSWREA